MSYEVLAAPYSVLCILLEGARSIAEYEVEPSRVEVSNGYVSTITYPYSIIRV